MKKAFAVILVLIMALFTFASCRTNAMEDYDVLVYYIMKNGTKEDNTYSITYMRMDLGSVWNEKDGSITIRADKSGTLIFESVYPDHTTSITCKKGKDLCKVVDTYYDSSEKKISTGEISIKSFSTANKTVQSFKSTTAAEYKELLGWNADLLIRDVKIVLDEINIGITVADLGFKNYED